jgi:hypothetical protein
MHKIRLFYSIVLFLTGTHRLLVTNKEQLAFASANNCQGQMQTPQSDSAVSSLLEVRLPKHFIRLAPHSKHSTYRQYLPTDQFLGLLDMKRNVLGSFKT